MKYLALLMLLLAGCTDGDYIVTYGPYCNSKDQAEARRFILDCVAANKITSIQGKSPEDVITVCRETARMTCPNMWLVRERSGFNEIPCSEVGTALVGPNGSTLAFKACRDAGYSPLTLVTK